MNFKSIFLILLMLVFSEAQQSRAFEFWTSQGISQRLDYGLELSLENQQRFSTGEGQVIRGEEVMPTLIWHYSPRYDFQVGYDYEAEWSSEGDLEESHRALGAVIVKLPFGKWSMTSSQRWDAGDREGEFVSDFRHLARVETSLFSSRWIPFVSNEWFLDLVKAEVRENRAQIGLLYRWNRAFETEIYGMRRDFWGDEVSPEWGKWILGVNLKLKF